MGEERRKRKRGGKKKRKEKKKKNLQTKQRNMESRMPNPTPINEDLKDNLNPDHRCEQKRRGNETRKGSKKHP